MLAPGHEAIKANALFMSEASHDTTVPKTGTNGRKEVSKRASVR